VPNNILSKDLREKILEEIEEVKKEI